MVLILTPAQFARRSDFYHQMAALTSAGLGLIAALQHLERSPPDRSFREPIRNLLAELTAGCTFAESLRRLRHRWLPEFDVALLEAGEKSGRLDACFRLLAKYYNDRAKLARELIADLLYPAFLFHFAVFITPFPRFFASGDSVWYLERTFGVLLPLYALVALVVYVGQGAHGELWRSLVERVLRPVPVLGVARRDLALGRLAAALGALLDAGVTVIEAWELAGAASGSPALRRTILAWRPDVQGGRTPSEAIMESRFFPDVFSSQYAAGEISGKLDETLKRLHAYYEEEGSRKLHAVARWLPRAVYLLIMLAIAYNIIRFYMGYFGQLKQIMGP